MFRLTAIDPLTSEVISTETVEGIGRIKEVTEWGDSLIVLGGRGV